MNLIFNTLESTPFKLQSFIHTVAESGRIVEFEKQKQAIESIGKSYSYIAILHLIKIQLIKLCVLIKIRCYRKLEEHYHYKNELKEFIPWKIFST